MAGTYACPTCKSQTTIEEGDAPLCVPCKETMVLAGATLDADAGSGPSADPPIAPVNVDAYKTGLDEIEKAKASADTQEREYLRAKEYASKTKKRLEAAEATLRATVQAVADRLRPKPLFDAPDHHSAEELVALMADAGVDVTAEAVRKWTDAERADARAYALAAHSEQPRLIPPFLWAPGGSDADPDPPEEDDAADAAQETQDAAPAPASDDAPPEPEAEPHRYPTRGKKGRTRRKPNTCEDGSPGCIHGNPILAPCKDCQAAVETLVSEAVS